MGRGYGIPGYTGSFKAESDLSTKQFHIVKMSPTMGVGYVKVASSSTDLAIGVLENKPEGAGWPAEVVVLGESKLVAGTAITAGQFVGADGDGHALPYTFSTAGNTTQVAVGRALEDAAVSDVFRVFVQPVFVQITV